ncbi:uncharacterized protein [Physcomitrium patens]|uniref:RING-type domain-containing protein n=1 Tax=Physcomitrium patens TaxID=3218 RepID=A0A2K1IJF5_PHYPA|nr:E3 ubiquitin-protein ligase FANCL-like [Physcomitrium patens]XP_024362240.1 E3 ubiquitin-protein ligase FANCL-like [Physcomitrium patens]PNR29410.1 hypothetical protein PHYPA_028103 [Physcomitrium patens]|eukprot:XP_024362239.1 E3 ubiquitin-protein ligase FANCL-like [Physcomitrella patens]
MATTPTVLPLNADFTAYRILLPVKDKEFVVGIHNVEAGKTLCNANLDCCGNLLSLLTGFEHIVHERMKQSSDVTTFVEELKDVLEHILIAQPQVKLPLAEFYVRIYSEIEEIGWEHVAWIAPNFMSIHLRFFDEAKREHLVQIQLSSDYPEREPSCNADLPIAVEVQWRAGGRLKDILSQFEQAAEKFQDFWIVMEDIDKHVWVMEPEHPSRSNCFRRIALGGHCSLCITVEPLSPRVLPEYRFFGSDTSVDPLRQRMSSNMDCWRMERLVRENLEDLLDVTFPSPQDSNRDDVSSECIICYSYRLLDGKEGASERGSVPDRVCDNGSCGRPFHTSCLAEWLRSLPTTRQSFDVLFGSCPHCSHPIVVKCSIS